MKKSFSFEEIKILLDATFKLIDAGKTPDNPNSIATEIQFLNMFIETLVTRTLSDKSASTKPLKEQFEQIKTNFNKLKLGVQEATAMGFQEPMQRFAKKPIEYYCTIRPVVDATSKLFH